MFNTLVMMMMLVSVHLAPQAEEHTCCQRHHHCYYHRYNDLPLPEALVSESPVIDNSIHGHCHRVLRQHLAMVILYLYINKYDEIFTVVLP